MSLMETAGASERLRFFRGQRLFAADLQALETFNREMRWLHNRSLHQFGIASGYAVTGNKGDREVSVGPGYALDDEGHEIVLTETRVIPIPPVANDGSGNPVFFDLTVSYDDSPKEAETRDGICAPRSAVRLREAPVFCWVELTQTGEPTASLDIQSLQARSKDHRDELLSGARVRLARAEIFNCKLQSKLSIAQRTNARPPAQRFFASGGDAPDFKRVWAAAPTANGIALTTTVDTNAANFQSPPTYLAHVVGDREVKITIGGSSETLFIDGFVRTTLPTLIDDRTHAFVLTMFVPAILIGKLDLQKVAAALPAAITAWHVEWLGIED